MYAEVILVLLVSYKYMIFVISILLLLLLGSLYAVIGSINACICSKPAYHMLSAH